MSGNSGSILLGAIVAFGAVYIGFKMGHKAGEFSAKFEFARNKINEVNNLYDHLVLNTKLTPNERYDQLASLVRGIENNYLPLLEADPVLQTMVKEAINANLNLLRPL